MTAQISEIKAFTMTEQPTKTENTDVLYFIRPQAILSQLVWEVSEFNIMLLTIRAKPIFNDDENTESEHSPVIFFSTANTLLPPTDHLEGTPCRSEALRPLVCNRLQRFLRTNSEMLLFHKSTG